MVTLKAPHRDMTMNVYAQMKFFWQQNEAEPFAPSETALYFYLLNQANARHWQMPIRCATTKLCWEIKVTKPTLHAAREKLKSRGLITYTAGSSKTEAPDYSLSDFTHGFTDDFTDSFTGGFTDNFTIYNTKDNNTYSNKKQDARLSLDELKRRFLADDSWQESICSLLFSQGGFTRPDIQAQIETFFQIQQVQGVTEREEQDCRSHFVNWLKKQQTTTRYASNKQPHELRRGSAVPIATAKDYEGAF
jgi:hypothetical protein